VRRDEVIVATRWQSRGGGLRFREAPRPLLGSVREVDEDDRIAGHEDAEAGREPRADLPQSRVGASHAGAGTAVARGERKDVGTFPDSRAGEEVAERGRRLMEIDGKQTPTASDSSSDTPSRGEKSIPG
jgi:hypothetical protein